MRRSALAFLAVAASIAFSPGAAAASDRAEALAFIHRFTEAANGTDREAYVAFCAEDAVVIDHAPPYVFRGPKACQDHWDAVLAWVDQQKIVVSRYAKFAKPAFVEVSADRGYVVIPWTAQMSRAGRKEIERGEATFVLRRNAQAGWTLSSVTWTSLGFSPAPPAIRPAPRRADHHLQKPARWRARSPGARRFDVGGGDRGPWLSTIRPSRPLREIQCTGYPQAEAPPVDRPDAAAVSCP